MRRHPTFGDSLIALLLVVMELPVLLGDFTPEPWLLYVVTDVMIIAPIVIRRRHALLSCYLVLLAGLFQLLTQGPGNENLARPADIAMGIALYTMVVYVGRRKASLFAVWVLLGTAVWAVWRVKPANGMWQSIFVVTVIFAFCWVLGEFVGARRAYLNEMEQRLRLLESERDHQAKIAVAEERARIARELHDVVAHSVSIMVVQAGAARTLIDSQPQKSVDALLAVEASGRDALRELRHLLGLLTAVDDQPALAPQPGLDQLQPLIERMELAGLPVDIRVEGTPHPLPPGLDLTAYRIVQEALTNVLKYAQGGRTSVLLNFAEDELRLEVVDSGGVASDGANGSGRGLIGMRERVTMYGGDLEVGPRAEGGFRVSARLPLQVS
jgi:signal transduction histidine kinase